MIDVKELLYELKRFVISEMYDIDYNGDYVLKEINGKNIIDFIENIENYINNKEVKYEKSSFKKMA